MRASKTKAVIAGLAAIAVISTGGSAIAGKRFCNDGQGCDGSGQKYQDGNCRYANSNSNLTSEQREQLKTERKAFFEATRQDRRDLHAKRLALRAEIAKSDLDMKAATALQEEISQLQSDLDQKRLTHIVAIRKIDPDADRHFFGESRGRRHHGAGNHYDRGRRMGGNPEDCPFK